MNIKIQGGGGGVYANSGSCYGTANYLEHEDKKNLEQGRQEHFFTHEGRNVPKSEIVRSIDGNKAKLGKADAKYFVMTISPSKEELAKMGNTPEEQSAALKKYINNSVMPYYAQNFNKQLSDKDIMYFAKIHHERGEKGEGNLHAHVIISRKDMSNKIKLSPNTNHRGTEKGAIKGGFNRKDFFQMCESVFDQSFRYERKLKETFKHCNAKKNGTERDKKMALLRENLTNEKQADITAKVQERINQLTEEIKSVGEDPNAIRQDQQENDLQNRRGRGR